MSSKKAKSEQAKSALPVPPYQRRNPSPETKRIVVAHSNDANLLTEATEAGRRDSTSQKARVQSSQHQWTQKSSPDSSEARLTDAELTAAGIAGRRASTSFRRPSNRQSAKKPSSHSNIPELPPETEHDQNRPASVQPGAQRIAGIAGDLLEHALSVPSIPEDVVLMNATRVDEVYATETVNLAEQQQQEKFRRRKFFLFGCATSTIFVGAVIAIGVIFTRPSPTVAPNTSNTHNGPLLFGSWYQRVRSDSFLA